MKKKFVAMVLTFVMLVSLIVPASAAGTFALNVNKNKVEVNDLVEVTVTAPAIAKTDIENGIGIKLNFDKAKFEMVGEASSAIPGCVADTDITDAANANSAGFVSANSSNVTAGMTAGQLVIKAQFKAKAAGSAQFSVSIVEMANADGEDVAGQYTAPAAVTVTIPAPPVPATKITLDKTSISLSKAGIKTATLAADVEPDNTTDTVTWSVSPAGVVQLSATTGKDITVTAQEVGKATITAKAGSKTATCTVEVSACNHVKGTQHNFQDSTCQVVGNKEYWDCANNCGAVYVDGNWTTDKNATVIAKKDHTEGTAATCTTPAICSVCKQEYGNPLGHQLTKHSAVPATCTTAGNKDYWECQRCHEKYLDAAGKILESAENSAVIDALGHDVKKVEAKAPTCQVPGNVEYYECSRCHDFFEDAEATRAITDKTTVVISTVAHEAAANAGYASDADNHWQLCKWCGEKVGVTKHTFDADGKCACGAFKDGKVKDHEHTKDQGSKMMYDANKHWYTCSDPACAGHAGEEAHKFTTTTETINGKKYEVKTCVCGYVTRVEVKNNTTGTTIGTNPNAKNPYEKNDTTKKDDGKKVESGKTFDAGIALYVGLSVLSVTGGALVIGKKKEF